MRRTSSTISTKSPGKPGSPTFTRKTLAASLKLLISSTVWRQDHNGFTHQDPGFLDLVVNKSPAATRICLLPDVNTLLATTARCLESTDLINVIVCDKQKHLKYLDIEAAIQHCARGIGIWEWARDYAYEHGVDQPEADASVWPY